MKKITSVLALLVALVAMPAHAQVYGETSYPLAVAWDVDGEAADADQVVVVGDGGLTDSKTFNLTADPDVCRLVDITLVDNFGGANITAGTLTVAGKDCWGDPLTTTFTFTAGDDTGVRSLTVTVGKASAAYFSDVTAVTTGVLTGEGAGDTVTVGYTSNSVYGYSLYGTRVDRGVKPYRFVDIDGTAAGRVPVKQGTTTVDVTAVTALTNPFAGLAVGDLIGFNVASTNAGVQWRMIVTYTDANNIVVDNPVVLGSSQQFFFKKRFLSTDPQDGWIGVKGYRAVTFLWQEYAAGANTGGLVSNVECAYINNGSYLPAIQVDTDTVATGTVGAAQSSVDLYLTAFDVCRLGLKFGTNDDADAGTLESVYATIGLAK